MSIEATVLVEGVRAALDRHGMLGGDKRVLVAVSGGPDSLCLLHVLHELGCSIDIAHFDHGTRDGESAEDASFVSDVALKLSLPFHTERRAVEVEAAGSPMSFEEYARKARYEFLIRTALESGCTVIATGHHADDQAETVLMRILRGTTPRGLAGIPPIREEAGIRVVRPLLSCTRADILAYLEERDIPYRTDLSNADTRHLRNKVRHQLMPQLSEEYNPKLREALLRLSDVQRDETDLLNDLAEAFLRDCLNPQGAIARVTFANGHIALQRRAMLMMGWRHGADLPFERVEEARRFLATASTGRAFDLGAGLMLRAGRETVEVVAAHAPPEDDTSVPLAVPGETLAFFSRFTARILDSPPESALARYCSPTRQIFDADRLGGDVAVRHRRPGDRFTPFGMTGTKKLKDYFIDLGLPVTRRDAQVLVTAGGRIVWVVGHAISGHVAVTSDTERVIEIEVLNEGE